MKVEIANTQAMLKSPLVASSLSFFTTASTLASPPGSLLVLNERRILKWPVLRSEYPFKLLVGNYLPAANVPKRLAFLNSISAGDEEQSAIPHKHLKPRLVRKMQKYKQTTSVATKRSRSHANNSQGLVVGVSRVSPLKRSIASKDAVMILTGLTSISPVGSSKQPQSKF
jgi:hypothetical protein